VGRQDAGDKIVAPQAVLEGDKRDIRQERKVGLHRRQYILGFDSKQCQGRTEIKPLGDWHLDNESTQSPLDV
jgi:hypothetical protein